MRGAALVASLAMLLAQAAAAQQIVAARYVEPTDRYGHRVLGAGGEWAALTIDLEGGTVRRFILPENLVFEDLSPHLADLTGDGTPEVIVVESSLSHGARLAVYGAEGRIAATPHIGTHNRWLAPIGAADLNGDGHMEIAYIDRPHLAQVLRIWRFRDGRLEHLADRSGLTNHRIGWDFIPGGIRQCGAAPEIITASAGWRRVIATQYRDGAFISTDTGAYSGPEDLDAALICP